MMDLLQDEKVVEILKSVYDPELGISVYDLGLIYNIEGRDDEIFVTMTLTTPGCPLHGSMAEGVKNALEQILGVKTVHVEVVRNPPWTPERMTEEAKRDLGRA